MYKTLAKSAAVLVITLGLAAATARAQIATGFYSGMQSAVGTTDLSSGTTYGNTFVLSSTGEWDSRYITVSVNYRNTVQGIGLSGGAWSLAVFSEGLYLGTVYGEVISGDILRTMNGSGKRASKRTRMSLRATGGTGMFEARRDENISGTLDMTTNLQTLETTGTAFMNF